MKKPVQTSNYWSALQEKDDEPRIAGVLRPANAALSGVKLGLGSSKKAINGSSHTGVASGGPGVGLDSFVDPLRARLRASMLLRAVIVVLEAHGLGR